MKRENFLVSAAKTGLIGGAIALFLCFIGMIEIFSKRDVIEGILTLGQFVLWAIFLGAGLIASRQKPDEGTENTNVTKLLLTGATAGFFAALVIAFLIVFGHFVNVRAVFLNASPTLYDLLTYGQGVGGAWIVLLIGAIAGLAGAAYLLLPKAIARPLSRGVIFIFFMALLSGIFRVLLIAWGGVWGLIARALFGLTGLTLLGTILFFAAITGGTAFWSARGEEIKSRANQMPKRRQNIFRGAIFLLIAVVALGLPQVSGPFIAQVIVIISLYILMGLGLNITLGFAGLLDLGFVAFYAVGAYTVGLLTSYGPFGLQHISFWVAVPIAVLVAMLFGAFLGLPVLGVRGDYLAIATLGFGEIVRLLAGSDFLAKYFGGPQGVIGIQKPCIGTLGPFLTVDVPRVCNGLELGKPQDIYYIAVVSAIFIAFVAWRLRESRLGRAWMAIREDEDVAEALGINLIQTKLLAYMLGAAFAGLGGAIFTVLIGSIFASSMQLIVSINVVSLIIVGGMGSIPGVIVGAIALIGLPELLREVSEFRYLIYGFTLIAMMLAKPEGLWPSQAARRELHHEDQVVEV